MEYISRSEAETEALGERLARSLPARGVVIAMYGELGAGKTELLQFVRTAQKAPYVGDMKFKRSGAASAAPLRSLSGCARGCRSEYNDQSFHWLH